MNSPTQIRSKIQTGAQPLGQSLGQTRTRHIASNQNIYAESEEPTYMLCCYQNFSPTVQVIRSMSVEIPEWHLERVVFPGQRLMFHAPEQTSLQIYTANNAGNLLSDTIPCDRIKVNEH